MAEKHAPKGAPERSGSDREIDYKSVWRFTAFLLLLVAAGLVSMWGLFHFLRREIARSQPPAPPLAAAPETPLPPEPRLEGPPGPALQALRAKEEAVLETWGWADKARSTAVIPVDRAIEIAAEKGLPIRHGNPVPAGGATK